jgi:hypothetical protein
MISDLELESLFKQLDTLFTEPENNQLTLPLPPRKDVCPKCGTKGVFVRMALICPKDKTLIGGM